MIDITKAKKEASEVYKNLKPLVVGVVEKHSKEIDSIVAEIRRKSEDNIMSLSNMDLQKYMLALSTASFDFTIDKDLSLLMQDCAILLAKEAEADSFNTTAGTAAVRSNQSIIDAMPQKTVSIIQTAVANAMKSKLDEAHRMISVLQNILISRNAENKLRGAAEKDERNDLRTDSIPED